MAMYATVLVILSVIPVLMSNHFTRTIGQTDCTTCDILGMQKETKTRISSIEESMKKITSLEESVKKIEASLSKVVDRFTVRNKAKDCADLYENGIRLSGVYVIKPRDNNEPIGVYCDMKTDGGGWTVFQKRQDGSEDFYRGWNDYKLGFGNLNGEFWLGNNNINRLTIQDKYHLRFDMEDTSGTQVYAAYDMFSITSEETNYQLSLGQYSGNAGDSFTRHRGNPFSTKDKDNDKSTSNCAVSYSGAWWYDDCHSSNLNGLYHHGAHDSNADGVNWDTFKGHNYSLKKTNMKIRPAGFKSTK